MVACEQTRNEEKQIMSLGIAFKGSEGIVLAADSRVTLTRVLEAPDGTKQMLPATFDNATKLLKVGGQDYVAAVTYGIGAIGEREPRTSHSFLTEFEQELEDDKRLSVEEFSQALSDFFMARWKESMPKNMPSNQNIAFLIAGYDEGTPYGRIFEIFVPNKAKPVERNAGEFGLIWGGQKQIVDRLLQGFDEGAISAAKAQLDLDDKGAGDLRTALRDALRMGIPYQFLPLQDCVDLAIFLVRTTIGLQTWMVDVRGVGGEIDVATITRVGGIQPVQVKTITGEEEE